MSENDQKIEELLTRGVKEIINLDSLREKLKSGKKLRVKLGIDPTSPNIHIGRSIPLLKLKDFQDLGHTIVLIIGNFTGVIGDNSDKESERSMLKTDEVEKNLITYKEQVSKIIDIDKSETHYNSEWLSKLNYSEIGKQADNFSLSDFISRENIKVRLDAGKRVSLRELLYPLMQGYDSVAVKADVEIGGTDQRFNLLSGRALQKFYGQEPQDIIMNPLIEGLDGRKMSSSWDNTINITDNPFDMFGKVMSLRDELVGKYFELVTRMPRVEIEDFARKGKADPKGYKMSLAKEIVKIYHGEKLAKEARENFVNTFSKKEIPKNILEINVKDEVLLVDTLTEAKIISSKSEFRRLVSDGAVKDLNKNEVISDVDFKVKGTTVFKIGKHRFIKVIV